MRCLIAEVATGADVVVPGGVAFRAMRGQLAAWWRGYREGLRAPKGYCAVCRENLAPLGGGIEVAHLERVCSDACAREHESNAAW